VLAEEGVRWSGGGGKDSLFVVGAFNLTKPRLETEWLVGSTLLPVGGAA